MGFSSGLTSAGRRLWPLDLSQLAVFRIIVQLDGTRTTRFTSDAAFDRFPNWSPDGSRIVFDSKPEGSESGRMEVYSRPFAAPAASNAAPKGYPLRAAVPARIIHNGWP